MVDRDLIKRMLLVSFIGIVIGGIPGIIFALIGLAVGELIFQ